MGTDAKRKADAPAASSPVLEKHVAAAFAFSELEKQMGTLAYWLANERDPKRQLYAATSTTLLAAELVQRLLAMQIALAGEV